LNAVARDLQLSNILYIQTKSYTVELNCLIQEPYFATFNRTLKIKDLDFNITFHFMQDTALGWHATLMQLLGNQQAHRASYGNQKAKGQKVDSQDVLVRQAYVITSIICFF